MFQDKQMPITLQIADSLMDLHVLGFTGQDALNEPYRFDIDLISCKPHLDVHGLAGKAAWLAWEAGSDGIHGLIDAARQIYAGTCLSLYRITLAPSLLKLEETPQRRVFKDISVPQVIVRLLEMHGFGKDCYRFESLVGLYPPREQCVQYDETDLHLLQRLCEEEGIHFRFEHSRTGHRLVFADDPASFPERQTPIRFHRDAGSHGQPAIHYLSERLTIDTSSRDPARHEWKIVSEPLSAALAVNTKAAINQPFDTVAPAPRPKDEEAHHRQTSARTLERLRCERRHIQGQSHGCVLTSGHIIQVQGHPATRFNDQWLLITVRHWGKQPQVLEGCDPHDRAAILGLTTDDQGGLRKDQPSMLNDIDSFEHGYRTSFSVLPWAMTFRPSCAHRKPGIEGYQHVTLMGDAPDHVGTDAPGRLPIRYDWQAPFSAIDDSACWPLADLFGLNEEPMNQLAIGDRLVVSHLDNDPDRPVICGVLEQEDSSNRSQDTGLSIRLNSSNLTGHGIDIHMNAIDCLAVESRQNLTLNAANATFVIGGAGITITGPQKINLETHASAGLLWKDDLRLTAEPGLAGAPLADRIWYIVHMSIPGLDQLARLEPRHFLFEGKTDEQGYLGLTAAQMRELSARYRSNPEHLCLVHPGCCMSLKDYFAQNWNEQRLRAFVQVADR